MKVLKVLYVGGHEELLLVDDLTASWEGWSRLNLNCIRPLRVEHRGGIAYLNLQKVCNVQVLSREIVLKETKRHVPDPNPFNEESHYEDPCN